jgi:hypothetical protein
MESNIHIFIIWEKAQEKTDELLNDIKKKFIIREIYEVEWSKENFPRNLKRFYGDTLPNPLEKIKSCGTGKFLVVVIEDLKPNMGMRKTSIGKQLVNTNVYDRKMHYRRLIGGKYPIHASINQKETNHDLTLIFGQNLEDVIKKLPTNWKGDKNILKKDLVGWNEWKDLKQLFYVLNSTTNYLVLRNFENYPGIINEDHKDIDILTDDRWQIKHILNMKLFKDKNGIKRLYVLIQNEKITFDIKYVGDSYYDEKWSKKMLDTKKFESGFYRPDEKNYFYSLLYHVLIHKKQKSGEYFNELKQLGIKLQINGISHKTNYDNYLKILNLFMKENKYRLTDSICYKLKHNEFIRLKNVAIHVWKEEGLVYLLTAVKSKIKKW